MLRLKGRGLCRANARLCSRTSATFRSEQWDEWGQANLFRTFVIKCNSCSIHGTTCTLIAVRMAGGGEQASWREVPDQLRDVWSALSKLGGVAAVAYKYADWHSSEALGWLKTSLPAVPESFAHMKHPVRDFQRALVERVVFYEQHHEGFPAVLRLVKLLGGWETVLTLVHQVSPEHFRRSRLACESPFTAVAAVLQEHVQDNHRKTSEGVNWGTGSLAFGDRAHGKRKLLRAVARVAVELPLGLLWFGESPLPGFGEAVGLVIGPDGTGTVDAAGEGVNPSNGPEVDATGEGAPSTVGPRIDALAADVDVGDVSQTDDAQVVADEAAQPRSGKEELQEEQQEPPQEEQMPQLKRTPEQSLPGGSVLPPAKKACVAASVRRERKLVKMRAIELEIEDLQAQLLAKKADLQILMQQEVDSEEEVDADLRINDVAATALCDFWLGATTGLLEKLGFCRAGSYLDARPGALEWYRRRAGARQTLGEAWFRYDYTSLMLYQLVLTCSDVGSQLLHLFSVVFLWQRWGSYRTFLAQYEERCGQPFSWESFDHGIFDQCLAPGLGNAYPRYRMQFWEAYGDHHKLYKYNQKGLLGHFLGQLVSSGVAGFEYLLKNGGGAAALLDWIHSLGVPTQSRSVEFVLLLLQRHLAVIYGVVSLDGLDFVGGGAVDELEMVVRGIGSATEKMTFFHNWLLARLPMEVLQILGPWTLADTEHFLCEARRSREAYQIVCGLGRQGEVFEREGAGERNEGRVSALLAIRARRRLFFPLPALDSRDRCMKSR